MAQLTTTKTNGVVPVNYTLCIKGECPKSATCLRYAATRMMEADVQRWNILSPAYLAQFGSNCPHYRSGEKVRYARGFSRMMSSLTVHQANVVKDSLVATFGTAMYYRMRKGTRPITPMEQETIYRLLEKQGVTTRPEFDAYVESYLW